MRVADIAARAAGSVDAAQGRTYGMLVTEIIA